MIIQISLSSINSSSSVHFIANLQFADHFNLYKDIRAAQWKDSSLLPLLNYLQNQITPSIDNLDRFLGLAHLHRVFRFRSSMESSSSLSSERVLLVIPISECTRVLQLAHDVENYVQVCVLCQQYKPTNQKPTGLMQSTIVVVDYFTKWVELFPL